MIFSEESFGFESAAIKQKKNKCASRLSVNTESEIIKGVKIQIPMIAANMSTVINSEFYIKLIKNGAFGILHRALNEDDYLKEVGKVAENCEWVAASIGVGNDQYELAKKLINYGSNIIVIDIAHGYSDPVIDLGRKLKLEYPHIKMVVGNTVNVDMMYEVQDFADAVKVGIAQGCFSSGTRILMSNGEYKNIEDIKLHDRVINKNGNPVEVIGVKFSGFKKILKYKNNLFYKETFVTPDHYHWIGDFSTIKNINNCSIKKVLQKPKKNGEGKFLWQKIENAKKSVLLMPKKINFELSDTFEIKLDDFSNSRRNMKGLKEFPAIGPSYELGYIYGTFLGDGNAKINYYERIVNDKKHRNTCGATSWFFGKNEHDIAEKLKKSLIICFNINVKIIERKNIIQVLVHNNNLTRLLLEFGKKTYKHLPIKYFCSDINYLKGILDGLIDSDGTYRKDGKISFCNTSPVLIEQFSVLFFLVNGYFPSIQCRKPSIGGLKNCKLENCNNAYIASSVNNPNLNLLDNYQINRINNLKIDNNSLLMATYDIEVDCETHSFIANNAIVHNSACETKNTAGCTEKQFSAILKFKEISRKLGIPVISDGGIREPADFVKSIGAGANSIMAGGIFAACPESAAKIIKINDVKKKVYAGMASEHVQNQWKGGLKKGTCSEGGVRYLDIGLYLKDLLENYQGALRSGITYAGGTDIVSFQNEVEFIRLF